MEDPSDDASPEEDGVEEGIVGAALGAGFCFMIIFLFDECDGDKSCEFLELGVVGWDGVVFVHRGEDDVTNGE